MKHRKLTHMILWFCTLLLFSSTRTAAAEQPIVHALLFYSPSCPHCHKIITEDLQPILQQYGDQVVIMGINTYTEQGHELFISALNHFNIPQETAGVPMLVIGETVLVGSLDIPQHLPEIIVAGLDSGGITWSAIPGLEQLLEEQINPEAEQNAAAEGEDAPDEDPGTADQSTDPRADVDQSENNNTENQDNRLPPTTSDISEPPATIASMTVVERFMQDTAGNSISTLVLAGMIFSVFFAGVVVLRSNPTLKTWPNWVVAVLALIGISVAGYMAFVEMTSSEAICGPVGDCNTVQQSEYAFLFGVIPIGVLGVIGYLVLGILWFLSVYGPGSWRSICVYALWVLSLAGTLFSIYLTFLEPFVIGATCAWCLTSAIVMSLIFWATSTAVIQMGGDRKATFRT